jgi:uncharacterized protein YdaU (DUF1376 family)
MSRSWIAFYIGDYLKDTQALTTEQHGAYLLLLMECWQKGQVPLDARSRAAIARVPLPRWKKISAPIDAFFAADGTNKRASAEITKAEMVSLKRAIAGAAGGHRSGLSKAIARGQQSKIEANAYARLKQTGRQPPQQTSQQHLGISEANHKSDSTASSLAAARESAGDQLFFVIHDTPEWHAHQRYRAQNALAPLVPTTILRDGIAYRGARVPYPTPPGYEGAPSPQPATPETP